MYAFSLTLVGASACVLVTRDGEFGRYGGSCQDWLSLGALGFVGFVGLVGLVGFIGFVGFVGFVGLVELVELIGFVGFACWGGVWEF